MIDLFVDARKKCTFGRRRDHFDHRHLVGWTFQRDAEHKSMVVLITNSRDGSKWMEAGKPQATYRDITRHVHEAIQTNEWGWAPLKTRGGKGSVWVEEA